MAIFSERPWLQSAKPNGGRRSPPERRLHHRPCRPASRRGVFLFLGVPAMSIPDSAISERIQHAAARRIRWAISHLMECTDTATWRGAIRRLRCLGRQGTRGREVSHAIWPPRARQSLRRCICRPSKPRSRNPHRPDPRRRPRRIWTRRFACQRASRSSASPSATRDMRGPEPRPPTL